MAPSRPEMRDPALRARVIWGVVLALVAIVAVVLGGWFFAALVLLALIAMAYEWVGLVAAGLSVERRTLFTVQVAAGGVLAILLVMVAQPQPALLALLACALIGGGLATIGGGPAGRIGAGALYLGAPALCLVWLRNDPTHGLGQVLWLLLAVWSTDTMAYFAGRTIGGPKLAPAISPGKTWAGLAGGMVGAALVGLLAARLVPLPSLVGAALLASALAVVAQAGDLFESWMKRQAGVKDSGRLIPGHGGALDRLDGLLTAAPAFAVALLLWGGR